MSKPKAPPVALTIAGSDSGGGAGIQADLKTFAALKVHGASAVTCLTAQSPRRVAAIPPAPPEIILAQIETVIEDLAPAAVKTGVLYNARIIRAVVNALSNSNAPLVVDPVMISTSGVPLLLTGAVAALESELIPRAALVTPNLAEVGAFLGHSPGTPDEMRRAARALHARWRCAVLVKGGHLRGAREAADFYFDGVDEFLFTAPFVPMVRTHGTGCVYSAAIAAWLARGRALPDAIRRAKEFVTRFIVEGSGGH